MREGKLRNGPHKSGTEKKCLLKGKKKHETVAEEKEMQEGNNKWERKHKGGSLLLCDKEGGRFWHSIGGGWGHVCEKEVLKKRKTDDQRKEKKGISAYLVGG